MRFATFNICGWKSAINKRLLHWIKKSKIDLLAIQELRAERITKPLIDWGYRFYFNPSKFHGTAIISKKEPIKVTTQGICERFDQEGRFFQAEFDDFLFINVYMPHGGREKQNLSYKLEAYENLIKYLAKLKKPVILSGDFNIAHTEVDLARPKENETNIMFTKEERKQIDRILQLGFIDVLRRFSSKNNYTWWLRAFNAKKRNIGWRLDYIFVSKQLESFLKDSFVPDLDISDHCPVIVELSELKFD